MIERKDQARKTKGFKRPKQITYKYTPISVRSFGEYLINSGIYKRNKLKRKLKKLI